ncbi:hypothetical protein Pcinc_027053 [Petrolisthes cinctipes]|uniref:Uncharacterized protein n=1 Tax=Petrolisthes cinctipes TaxID=88211 RepID=A0AAE1F6U2_PETCI|nr:hypothetical protein Pcinc_027053 [Petrolisthes cinctipes]
MVTVIIVCKLLALGVVMVMPVVGGGGGGVGVGGGVTQLHHNTPQLEALHHINTTTTSSLLSPLYTRAQGSLWEDDVAVLVSFLVGPSFGSHFLLISDNSIADVGVAARACFGEWADTVLLNHHQDLGMLEVILKDPRRPLDSIYVVVLCSTQHTLALFQKVRARGLESTTVHWFVLASSLDLRISLHHLLREGAQVTVFTKEAAGMFKMDVSRVSSQGRVTLEDGGWWRGGRTTTTAPQPRLLPDLLHQYSNFWGRRLRVAANNNWPFLGLKLLQEESGEAAPISGIDISILDALTSTLNFSYQLVVPPDRAWGGPQPDGTVTGLIGMVARHEANLAICEITITDQRETVVDFTAPYWLESLTLVSRAPRQRDRSLAVFWPFTALVWALIGVATVVMGPVLWVVVWAQRGEGGDTPPPPPRPSLQQLTFNMFRSLVVQENLLVSQDWPLRFVFIAWYFFCYNVYAMYAGTLTAVLAIPTFEKPVDSLTDLPLASLDGFAVGTLKDSSTEFLFRGADSGIYHEVWQLFHPIHSLLPDPELGFDKVLKDKFVLINSELNAEIRATVRGRHRYHFGRDTFYPHGYGIACTTGAPFRLSFEKMLAWITEAGLINFWAEQEIQKVSGQTATEEGVEAGDDTEGSGPGSLTLQHLQAAFLLLVCGALVAGVVFLMEVLKEAVMRICPSLTTPSPRMSSASGQVW